MTAFFEKLWNGQIAPYKTCGQGDPEVDELVGLIERNEVSLDKELTGRQKDLLKNYTACCEEYRHLITVHAFREGFSLASKLLTGVLSEDL